MYSLGKKTHEGIGSIFIEHSTTIKYVIAFLLASIASLIIAGLYFLLVLTGVLVGIFVVYMANRNFGGVNGDVMGAANEISRTATLLVWVLIL